MKSIGSKILMVALLNILLAGLLIGSVSIYTFSTNSKAQIAQKEKLLLEDYDLMIKSATESLITSLKPIENAIESGELGKEDVEDTSRLGLTDGNGVKIIEEFIRMAKADGRFC